MKLYLRYASILFAGQMQYKASFFMTAVGQFFVSFSVFLGIYFMFERFEQVEGFSYPEVLLCFSTVLAAYSFAECFVRGFDTFPTIILNGEFDRMLVRPRSTLFQIMASRMEFSRLARFFQACIIMAYAISSIDTLWTWQKTMTLGMMIIGGFFVYTGLFIVYAAFCFYTIEGLEFFNIFTDGSREFGKYPLVIYGKHVLAFFTYMIPVALFQYYPFLVLIDRSQRVLDSFLPLLGILFIFPCLAFWKIGLRKYQSTGS